MNSGMLRTLKFIIGPLLFFLIQSLTLSDLSTEGQAVLACTAWIAFWWITEPVDLAVTSLMPIIIFPLSGALPIEQTTASYGNPIIFLYLGGFIIGLGVEKWNLHKRIAYAIIRTVGNSPKRLLLGLMVATAFLSMWISNTATAIMMLPIGISVVNLFEGKQPLSKNLLLGIAYAASIGGMATLIGTPPNLIFAGIVKESLGMEISFLNWMLFAFPLCCILLLLTWYYLGREFSNAHTPLKPLKLESLGKISIAEKRVSFIFLLTAFLWLTRSYVLNLWLPMIDDTIIAIFGGLLMLVVPVGNKQGKKLMDWEDTHRIPWNVLILFGAGLAIAKGFSATDLTQWLGQHFEQLAFLPLALVIILILASINFLTEITSNTATASMLLPILITLAYTLDTDPLPLMAGAAIAASCAFMLPVATPPNAIVFSSRKITIPQMAYTGFVLNILSIVLTYLFITYAWPLIF